MVRGDATNRWCPSSAVGEMEEEIAAVTEATGWPLRIEFLQTGNPDSVQQRTADLTAAINSGRPVLVYNPGMDMVVAYGYEEQGKTLLLRDYGRGQEAVRVPPAQLGFLLLFPEEHREGLSPRQALEQALRRAVHNWERDTGRSGPGEYWYGKTAFAHWSKDLREPVVAASEPTHPTTSRRFVSWFCFFTLKGARRDAAAFLRENGLERAAAIYDEEMALLSQAEADGLFTREGEWTERDRAAGGGGVGARVRYRSAGGRGAKGRFCRAGSPDPAASALPCRRNGERRRPAGLPVSGLRSRNNNYVLPFPRLHSSHRALRLPRSVAPPLDSAISWSTWSTSP